MDPLLKAMIAENLIVPSEEEAIELKITVSSEKLTVVTHTTLVEPGEAV